jgi:hypothetical protein
MLGELGDENFLRGLTRDAFIERPSLIEILFLFKIRMAMGPAGDHAGRVLVDHVPLGC